MKIQRKCAYCRRFVFALEGSKLDSAKRRASFKKWAAPLPVSDKSVLCKACSDLFDASIGVNNESAKPSKLTNLFCLICGISVTKKKHTKLVIKEHPSDLDNLIFVTIAIDIAPRQVMPGDRVCSYCYPNCKRAASKLIPSKAPAVGSEAESESTGPSGPEPTDVDGYKRSSNSSRRCAIDNCKNTSRHRITEELRIIALSEHKFYFPVLARLCHDHLDAKNWGRLNDMPDATSSFTEEQILHKYRLLKRGMNNKYNLKY